MMAGRKPAHWAKRHSISNGTLSRLSENNVPGPEILTVMQRTENVNVNWLLGSGRNPFMIDTHIDQTSFIDYLNYHSEDTDYHLDYLLAENLNTLVVVFSQPASMQFKDKTIGYKHLEVLAGPITEATLKTLSALKHKHAHSHEFILSDIQTRQLTRGEFGTYLLFGDTDTSGLIPRGVQSPSNAKINDLAGHYDSKNKLPPKIIIIDEVHRTLSDNNIHLLPSQITALSKVLNVVGLTGSATFEQIKSAAQLANVPLSKN